MGADRDDIVIVGGESAGCPPATRLSVRVARDILNQPASGPHKDGLRDDEEQQ